MRIFKMHLYTRLALIVAIILVAKCSAVLGRLYHEHETYGEDKIYSQKHEIQRREKIIQGQRPYLALLLESFFGTIDFDSAYCMVGECLSQKECTKKNGTTGDRCAQGFGVCCVTIDVAENYGGGDTIITGDGGLFFSPPSTAGARQDVAQRLFRAQLIPSDDVVQIKFVFNNVVLEGPEDGDCNKDEIMITGANPGPKIPALCGNITNQHLYMDIDNSIGPYEIIVFQSVEATTLIRKWDLEIKYLRELKAVPRRCLQYHTAIEGELKSFNFNGDLSMAINEQTYSICFGYVVGYCDVNFNFARLDLGNINNDCYNDYLFIDEEKHCGDIGNYSVRANATGPIITVTVRTDSDNSMQAMGFNGTYLMLPCEEYDAAL